MKEALKRIGLAMAIAGITAAAQEGLRQLSQLELETLALKKLEGNNQG